MFICSFVQVSIMPHRRRKSHSVRNAVIAIIVLILVISIVVVAFQMSGGKPADLTPPTYSDVTTSSTTESSSCTFNVLWTDDVHVSGYIFETNDTGTFVNDTWTPFSTSANLASAYATVTKTLNGTVGNVVSWRFWCNDTSNNWNSMSLQSLLVSSSMPRYSGASSSSTNAGSSCTFSVLWNDTVNLSGYIFETNNSGTFVNDTWMRFSSFVGQNSAYSRVTKTLDDTIGDVVQWRFWCNDTNNNWNVVSFKSIFADSNKVLLVTSMGNITIELYDDMPITTGNFKNLVRTKVYDGTIFHRIVPGFVIQGGDATSKGITVPPIQDELPNKHSNVRGSVAMAKTSQPNSATSQFFVNLNDTNAASLDSNYSVFGTVIAGMDVVDAISHVPISPPNDGKPLQDVTLISARFIK